MGWLGALIIEDVGAVWAALVGVKRGTLRARRGMCGRCARMKVKVRRAFDDLEWQ